MIDTLEGIGIVLLACGLVCLLMDGILWLRDRFFPPPVDLRPLKPSEIKNDPVYSFLEGQAQQALARSAACIGEPVEEIRVELSPATAAEIKTTAARWAIEDARHDSKLVYPRPLKDFPTGSMVFKPNAQPHDLAYNREGRVVREIVDAELMSGVQWMAGGPVLQYPRDTMFFSTNIEEVLGAKQQESPMERDRR